MITLFEHVIFYAIFVVGLITIARTLYAKSAGTRHRIVNRAEIYKAVAMEETDRLLRENEHQLWPDKKLDHTNCAICGPGPLQQGLVPSKYIHPFFVKKMETISDGYGSWKVERIRAAMPEYAEMVSSAVYDEHGANTGQHTLMLDLDFPCTLMESTSTGHYHFYGDRLMSWRRYKAVLKAMSEAGLIEQAYYRAACRQNATMLRPPWVKKEFNAPTMALDSMKPKRRNLRNRGGKV